MNKQNNYASNITTFNHCICGIVFRGELFLGTFSAHQKKYQAPKKNQRFFKRV